MTTNGENQAPIPAAGSSGESKGGIIGATALAVIIVLALLDAVVETIWSGSPIRWWVAPPVVLFVALVVWLWRPGGALLRRVGPGSAASTLIGGLLLLLAATAWLPGGQADGVRMLGQPTPVVLAAAMAALVALATYVIIRGAGFLQAMPRLIVQLAFALLGIYALASFGLAIKGHVDFVALFQGGALWQRLPRWLQGTFLGGLVLVPIAVIAQFVRIGGHVRRGQPVRVLIHQTTALVMSLVMALSGLVVPGATTMGTTTMMPRPAGTPPPDVPPPTVEEMVQTQKQMFGGQDPVKVGEDFVRAAEQELSRTGADQSDIGAKAVALGRDTGKIFEFMRDQVALEPYTGVLRGARGTLAAGAGNTLDRALLAQALLEAAGVESRLVAGRLSATQANGLLNRFLAISGERAAPPRARSESSPSSLDEAARDVAIKTGVPTDVAATSLRRSAGRTESFWWKANEQRAAHFEFVSSELKRTGMTPLDNRDAVLAKLRDRLLEHYWLQTKDGTGAWIDFDPSAPDSKIGTAYASSPAVLGQIPADKYHRFELQLRYRTGTGAKPTQEVLLKREVASADALFQPLEFRVQPAEAMPDAKALRAMDAKQRVDRLRAIKKYQPIMRVGAQATGGRVFDLEGHTYDAKTGDPMGAAGGLMGSLLGFGGEEEAPKFLDVQVVLRMTGPGRGPMTQTRTLVRAADTLTATFAPPIGEWEILVQPQWISPDLAGFQILGYNVALARSLTEALKGRRSASGVALPPPIPQQLLQLGLLRQSATADILSTQSRVRAFVDQPTLTIAGHKLTALRPDEGGIVAERTIDIVENSLRFVGKDSGSHQAAFDAAVAQGAADCALEQRFLQEAFPGSAAESGANVFERARLERRALVLASPKDQDTLKSAGLADSDLEWIRSNEAPANRLLIAKAAQGPAAWWSVGPDGTTVLRVSGGQGQAHAEHEVDVMLISLKLIFGGICIYEMHHIATRGEWSNLETAKFAFCALAGPLSFGFAALGLHAASWVLIGVEVVEFIGAGIWETSE